MALGKVLRVLALMRLTRRVTDGMYIKIDASRSRCFFIVAHMRPNTYPRIQFLRGMGRLGTFRPHVCTVFVWRCMVKLFELTIERATPTEIHLFDDFIYAFIGIAK